MHFCAVNRDTVPTWTHLIRSQNGCIGGLKPIKSARLVDWLECRTYVHTGTRDSTRFSHQWSEKFAFGIWVLKVSTSVAYLCLTFWYFSGVACLQIFAKRVVVFSALSWHAQGPFETRARRSKTTKRLSKTPQDKSENSEKWKVGVATRIFRWNLPKTERHQRCRHSLRRIFCQTRRTWPKTFGHCWAWRFVISVSSFSHRRFQDVFKVGMSLCNTVLRGGGQCGREPFRLPLDFL